MHTIIWVSVLIFSLSAPSSCTKLLLNLMVDYVAQ
jgi:hypothetical protein